MRNWEEILNHEQCQAVTAGDGPVLVLAAAGTGKTRTLTHRVAYLIEQGVDPRSILLLTFTNRAAREMLSRAQALVGPEVGQLWSGTFHHVSNRFLRHYATLLGYKRDFVIIDRSESISLIQRIIHAQVTDPTHFPKKDVIAGIISRMQNTQLPFADLVQDMLPEESETVRGIVERIIKLYTEQKHEMGFMDFDDLLVNALRLLKEHPEVLDYYSSLFKYVLVDEYQDTNGLQAELVDLLASKHRNLMVVGDDFQCIYSWRGANFANIMNFQQRWPDAKVVILEQNYRSTPEILNVANACIACNKNQFMKTLRAVHPSGPKPCIFTLSDGGEQADRVIRMIQQHIYAGGRPQDIAVLYRSHFHAVELQMALNHAQIGYNITSGVGLFEQAHVRDVVSFLRVASGASDLFAFTRLLSLFPGCGEKTCMRLWEKFGHAFQPQDTTALETLGKALPKKAQDDWATISKLLTDYQYKQWELAGGDAVRTFLDEWYALYLQRAYDNAEDRIADITEFARQIPLQQRVTDFLETVALASDIDNDPSDSDAQRNNITLSSIHQAKGLEWPIVILIWCNEDLFPSPKAIADGDDSEERRLFYVAVTRAARELSLCMARSRFNRSTGGRQPLRPSRFIKEIPQELVQTRFGSRY